MENRLKRIVRLFLNSLEFEMMGGGITLLNPYPPVQYESYLSRYIIVTYIHKQLLYECSVGRQGWIDK